MSKMKGAASGFLVMGLAIIGVVAILGATGVINLSGLSQYTGTTPGQYTGNQNLPFQAYPTTSIIVQGGGGDTSSFDVIANDLYKSGTEIATPKYNLNYDGQNLGRKTGGTAVTTIASGKAYDILVNTSSTFTVRAMGIASNVKNNIIVSLPVKAQTKRYSMINPQTNANNTNNSALQIDSGGQGSLNWILQANGADQYASNVLLPPDFGAGAFYIAMDMNLTEFDKTVGQTELFSNEAIITRTAVADVDAGSYDIAWKVVPLKPFVNYGTIALMPKLQAKTGIDPLGAAGYSCFTAGSRGGVSIGLMLRAYDQYVDTRTGEYKIGVENNLGQALLTGDSEEICYK